MWAGDAGRAPLHAARARLPVTAVPPHAGFEAVHPRGLLPSAESLPPAGLGIPPRGVAHRSLMPNKLALRALRSGRRARHPLLIQRRQATRRLDSFRPNVTIM